MKYFTILVMVLASIVLLTGGMLQAQNQTAVPALKRPGAASPISDVTVLEKSIIHEKILSAPQRRLAIASASSVSLAGGNRLVAMQYTDGSWGWPLTAPPTFANIIGPITMGLAQAYQQTGNSSQRTALTNAGAYLLAKTNNYSPSDGYLAAQLDKIFGVTTYTSSIKTNFYDKLAAGTYDRNGLGTLYTTASYVNLIRTARASQGIANLAAWDIGMGLVGASMCGASTSEWIAGVKAEIDELDGNAAYDVLGLAGAVYGLAFVHEDFDPSAGQHAAASNINDLANILLGYQISGGGFASNSGSVSPGNETNQETGYAILALNEVNRSTYISSIQGAADYLMSVQLGTGGWDNYPGDPDGENNEMTGEALWGIMAAYLPPVYNSTKAVYYPTIQGGINDANAGDVINVAAGTYNEDVTINKNLKLYSVNGQSTTIVNGQTAGWGGGALRINSSKVTVGGAGKGFTFNSLTGGTGAILFACYVSGARDSVWIEENKFVAAPRNPGNNESYALLTDGGQTNQTYKNNIFDGLATPRFLVYVNGFADVGVSSTNINFIGNTFNTLAGGLTLSSSGGEVTGNYFQGTAGIGLNTSSSNVISGNFFQGAGNHFTNHTSSGVDVDVVLGANTFNTKVVIKNAGAYRAETFPWGSFVIVRSKIQPAIDAATLGDEVLVGVGLYDERIIINKSLTLKGATFGVSKKGFVVPVGYAYDALTQSIIKPSTPLEQAVVQITSDNVVFDGFVVANMVCQTGGVYQDLVEVQYGFDAPLGIQVLNSVLGPNTNSSSQDGTMGRSGLCAVGPRINVLKLVAKNNKIFDSKGNGGGIMIVGPYGPTYHGGTSYVNLFSGSVIDNNEIIGNHRSGIELAGGVQGGTAPADYFMITNNIIANNGWYAIGDKDNLKYGHGICFIRGGSDKTLPDANGSRYMMIENNEIKNNEKSGYYIGPKNKDIFSNNNIIIDNGLGTGGYSLWDGVRVDLAESYYPPGTYVDYGYLTNIPFANNTITGNGSMGFRVIQTPALGPVIAENNWWGTINGPTHVKNVFNIGSQGGSVTDNVTFVPWLNAAPPTGVAYGPITNNDIPTEYYSNFTDAIAGTTGGGTISSVAGTYTEQVEVPKSLTIQGAGIGLSIIQSPVTLTKYYTTSANNYPIVYVHGIDGVTIRKFTVDGAGRGNGNYRFQGIAFYNAGGAIDSCEIKDVRESPINGNQHGVGIYSYVDDTTPRTVSINDNTIYGFQKNGMALNGANLTANVDGNTVTGAGAVDFIAQNGIQIGFGGTGSITGNTVAGFSYTPGTDVACGMLLYQSGGSITTSNNIINQSQVGIYYINVGGTISGNMISATAAGVGTPNFWGIDADPGGTPKLKAQPFDENLASKNNGQYSVNSPQSITTTVRNNVLTGDGTNGIGLEMDALGTEILNVHASLNTITQWAFGVVFYKEPTATLTAVVDTNSIAGNVYGVYDQTGVLQDARYNWWGDASGPRDIKTLPNVPNYNNPTGLGDSVSSYVEYKPWFMDSGKTLILSYSLNITADHGSVERIPDQPNYAYETVVQLTAHAGPGYHFMNWAGDTSGSVNPISVTMNGDKNISAIFAIDTFTISASAGTNGNITPLGAVIVTYGSDTTFTFSPNAGYHVDSIIVDGVPRPVALSYTFTNVTADQTILVKFALNQYVVNITALHGHVDKLPNLVQYDSNTTVQLTAISETGYHFLRWEGDVTGITNPASLTMNSVKNVTAIFGIDSFTISPSSGPNGQILPAEPVIATYGSNQTFNLIPISGYAVDSIFIDGVALAGAPTYSFTDINADHAISVTFKMLASYANRYRTFIYDSLIVLKPIPKKHVADHWVFKIINTTSEPISEINIKFRRPVSEIIESGSMTTSGRGKDFILTGTLAPGDSVLLEGKTRLLRNIIFGPGQWHQYMDKLWMGSKNTVSPLVKVQPIIEIGELPMPNAGTVREDVFKRMLKPLGGLVVGIVKSDSSKKYGWVRMKKSTDMFKSLFEKNTGMHTVVNGGFLLFDNHFSFVKEQSILSPRRQNNKIFADLLTLKFNIAISDLGITPRGFGELRYIEISNMFANMLVRDIATLGDSMMTLAKWDKFLSHPDWYRQLDTALTRINAAFSAPIDTLSWSDTLKLTGTLRVIDTGILTPSGMASPVIIPRAVDNESEEIPRTAELYQNYPNPFNPTTTIEFDLPGDMTVTLKIYNILGQEVATLLNHELMTEGNQAVQFDGTTAASGVYFYRILAEPVADDEGTINGQTFVSVKKMLLVK